MRDFTHSILGVWIGIILCLVITKWSELASPKLHFENIIAIRTGNTYIINLNKRDWQNITNSYQTNLVLIKSLTFKTK